MATDPCWRATDELELPDGTPAARAAIAGWLRHARRGAIHRAHGTAPPPAAATATGSLRLVLALDGVNRMRMPAGLAVMEHDLRRGDACVVHHAAWNLPTHACAKAFCTIDCSATRLRIYLRRTHGPGRDGMHARVVRHGSADPALHAALAAAEALDDDRLRRDAALLAAGIALRLLERPAPPAPPTAEARWQSVADWALEHLDQPVGRAQAARAAGMHPGHLSRLAQAITGQGFAAWLTAQRIARACTLLEGGMAVAEAGRRCGYPRPSHFVQVFRRATGRTPGAWKPIRPPAPPPR